MHAGVRQDSWTYVVILPQRWCVCVCPVHCAMTSSGLSVPDPLLPLVCLIISWLDSSADVIVVA